MRHENLRIPAVSLLILFAAAQPGQAQEASVLLNAQQAQPTPAVKTETESPIRNTIFDDKMLLDGYAQKINNESKETLIEMLKDDTLTSYISAAAVRVFRERFSQEVFSRDKILAEKILWRRLNRSDSSFVQTEVMYTLCLMDRYKYFNSMVPALIQKMDHYNKTVNELAYNALQDILQKSNNRASEARIVFNTLRKILFLSRKRLASVKEPGPKLKQKLELLRWSIKILGTEELKRLPSEVINLL